MSGDMRSYLIVNRPPADYRPSPEAARMWTEWFDGISEHLIDRGNPVFNRRTVGEVQSSTVLGGYTIIQATDLEHAIELVQHCPALRMGGSAEVGELTLVNTDTSGPIA